MTIVVTDGSSDARPADRESLRNVTWPRFIKGPDPQLLETLYVPALGIGLRYDRCCSYFSSSVLAAAAAGFGRLIERLAAMPSPPKPAVRLLVNEELSADDVRALTEKGDARPLEHVLQSRFKTPREALERDRLAMLAWLVNQGLLEIRVGVMRQGTGIMHAKFGVVYDAAGDAVVFAGSGNESAYGLVANYERLEVSTSWQDVERYREYFEEFKALWKDTHADVHTVPLPEALRLKLIKLAPAEPPILEPSGALARQRAAMLFRFAVEAPFLPDGAAACDATAMVDLWPHQGRVVTESAEAWPSGRLLCDEVGMGKTVEAILVLRRLMAGRGARRVLILLPAGLLKQWQAELREKGGLLVPRLEGLTTLVWPDDKQEKVSGLAEALRQDLLVMSRETARTEGNLQALLDAEPWDLVLMDEAHAARRRQQVEGEFNSGTLLLDLLRELQLRRKTRGILLLSATPMQTHPWEPWDLVSVLGEGGAWLSDFATVREYYDGVHAVGAGRCSQAQARWIAALVGKDSEFPAAPNGVAPQNHVLVESLLRFAPPARREECTAWLRSGSPLQRRMHRNTRATLREYFALGLLKREPPHRHVDDIEFDFEDDRERDAYEAVTDYIDRRFEQMEQERPGKGFVMTIYRRRASSSPQALRRSLERRRDGLERVIRGRAYDLTVDYSDAPESMDPDDLPEGDDGHVRMSSALPSSPAEARSELHEVEKLLTTLRSLGQRDTKRERFYEQLHKLRGDARAVLVFTEYTDTLEYLRDSLADHYESALGCYSGDGGAVWTPDGWQTVTKDVITKRLRDGELQVLLCTDAASEGLNLQAASAVINYDLPWNPSRVEQRIGRVDRIGQVREDVVVVNLFLKDSVDDRVYILLRQRCGLFEHFVGAMQPVLAAAKRMLMGQDDMDLAALERAAGEVWRDRVLGETYLQSRAASVEIGTPPVTRDDMVATVGLLDGSFGFKVTSQACGTIQAVTGSGMPRVLFSTDVATLERERAVRPLSPFDPVFRELADRLVRPGERLPLVVATCHRGAFRATRVAWLDGTGQRAVTTARQLRELCESWHGKYPCAAAWLEAEARLRKAAEEDAEATERRARSRERQGLERQVGAATLRLEKELARYLACVDSDAEDLNDLLYDQIKRDIATSQRLRQCLDRLGEYPQWDMDLVYDAKTYARELTDSQRKARLMGKELDAALQDPRWRAKETLERFD